MKNIILAMVITLTITCIVFLNGVGHINESLAVGDRCYASAVASNGRGGHAWGDSIDIAKDGAMHACWKFEGPNSGCKIVEAHCGK